MTERPAGKSWHRSNRVNLSPTQFTQFQSALKNAAIAVLNLNPPLETATSEELGVLRAWKDFEVEDQLGYRIEPEKLSACQTLLSTLEKKVYMQEKNLDSKTIRALRDPRSIVEGFLNQERPR